MISFFIICCWSSALMIASVLRQCDSCCLMWMETRISMPLNLCMKCCRLKYSNFIGCIPSIQNIFIHMYLHLLDMSTDFLRLRTFPSLPYIWMTTQKSVPTKVLFGMFEKLQLRCITGNSYGNLMTLHETLLMLCCVW